jgi:hypothetical protein
MAKEWHYSIFGFWFLVFGVQISEHFEILKNKKD